ncbi:MAG: hypothetical protein AAF243_01040 [Cyanobacteria bacterium P01_A01_bin.137]
MIKIVTGSPIHTLSHPAIVTVHLINQSPGAELVGGVTLYLEPVDEPCIKLMSGVKVDRSYEKAVAQGIQQALAELNATMTGLRIWWCDWLWHPIDSRPSAFTRAAARAIAEILPWLELTTFVGHSTSNSPTAAPPFPSHIFEQSPISSSSGNRLQPSLNSRWTIRTPLISHITQVRGAHLLSVERSRLVGHQSVIQTTLSFKAIASTQRVCPVDKLLDFRIDNGEILNSFADNIRSELPNARGFDVMVQQLMYQTSGPSEDRAKEAKVRRIHCLNALTRTLQQAINVGSKSYI